MSLQENLEKLQNDFSNLDPENMGSWPLPVKIVCWVLTAVIVVILSYQFVLRDQTESLNQEIQKEQTLRTSFESKVRDAANLDAYRAQMKEMKESFDALVLQLPKDTEVPGLLDDISNTGQSSGLNIESIKLLPEKKADFYVELPIDIQVSGGYHDFGTFASGIAGLPRIVTLHDFVIAPSGATTSANKTTKNDSGDARGSEELTMTITAKTYRYGNSSSGDAAKKGKDGGK
jgi:type IV pilus assembly protein PilO